MIVGDFIMDPSRLFIDVDDEVVLLRGKAERSSLIPYLVRAVQHVESVVRVENQLGFDVDDYDLVIAFP
jgi:osmotically-inducible protein OsmY